MNAEKLAVFDSCQRRAVWQDRYQIPRISVVGALYRALDAGLRATENPSRAAEDEFMALAANPGLSVIGRDVYAVAMHHSRIAGIVSLALRSAFKCPWTVWDDPEPRQASPLWRSALYDAGNGIPRRVVLVDRWSDDRKESELRSWRTLGEISMLSRPISVTAVTIGASKSGRRHSAWTKCYRHPKNNTFRFKRKGAGEDLGANWKPEWREDTAIRTEDWLSQMQKDDCITEHVNTVQVPVHPRRQEFVEQIRTMDRDMLRWERSSDTPPMRMSGCYAFTPCPFLDVCFGKAAAIPELHGFVRRSNPPTALGNIAAPMAQG